MGGWGPRTSTALPQAVLPMPQAPARLAGMGHDEDVFHSLLARRHVWCVNRPPVQCYGPCVRQRLCDHERGDLVTPFLILLVVLAGGVGPLDNALWGVLACIPESTRSGVGGDFGEEEMETMGGPFRDACMRARDHGVIEGHSCERDSSSLACA